VLSARARARAQCNGARTRTRKQLAAVVYSFNTRPTPLCD